MSDTEIDELIVDVTDGSVDVVTDVESDIKITELHNRLSQRYSFVILNSTLSHVTNALPASTAEDKLEIISRSL